MGYMDNTVSTIISILTTKGREVLARNDGTFRVTKFKVGDDEINYQLYNPGNIDSEDYDILALPVLEPCTNPDAALRFPLVTLPEGTKRVAEIIINPINIQLDLAVLSNTFKVSARTLYNQDSYYFVSFSNVNFTYINTLGITQLSSSYEVNNQSSETNYEYLVKADSTVQEAISRWAVNVTFKRNSVPGVVEPVQTDVTGEITTSTPPSVLPRNVLLFTMLVLGRDSGQLSTMDVYGTSGGRVATPFPIATDTIESNTTLGDQV